MKRTVTARSVRPSPVKSPATIPLKKTSPPGEVHTSGAESTVAVGQQHRDVAPLCDEDGKVAQPVAVEVARHQAPQTASSSSHGHRPRNGAVAVAHDSYRHSGGSRLAARSGHPSRVGR